MATLTLDTYQFVEGLKQSGIPEKQAKAIADGIRQVSLKNAATKEDILSLKNDLQQVKIGLLRWVRPLLLGQIAIFATIVKVW